MGEVRNSIVITRNNGI